MENILLYLFMAIAIVLSCIPKTPDSFLIFIAILWVAFEIRKVSDNIFKIHKEKNKNETSKTKNFDVFQNGPEYPLIRDTIQSLGEKTYD